jgi:hypothetical protein
MKQMIQWGMILYEYFQNLSILIGFSVSTDPLLESFGNCSQNLGKKNIWNREGNETELQYNGNYGLSNFINLAVLID